MSLRAGKEEELKAVQVACGFRDKQHLIAFILQGYTHLQYRLHLIALSIVSNSCSVNLNVYILPSDILSCLPMQVLVIVILHPLNIFTNSEQEDPYGGADQKTCIA